MSMVSVVNWESAFGNLGAIAKSQTLAAAGSLILNPNNGPYYTFQNVVRSVSLTSTSNLSGVNVTITGLGGLCDANGNPYLDTNIPISTTIAGPNNDTVDTVTNAIANRYVIFSSISSVSTSAAVAGLEVGLGSTGIAGYVFFDSDRSAWYASCSAQPVGTPTSMKYTFYGCLNKPSYQNNIGGIAPFIGNEMPSYTLADMDNFFTTPIGSPMVGVDTLSISSIPIPLATGWFNISDSSYTGNDQFVFSILQQGIR